MFNENKRLNPLNSFKVLLKRINIAFNLIKEKKVNIVWTNIKTRFYSTINSVGLKRDLNIQFKEPRSFVDFSLRLFEDSDINALNESNRHIRLVKAKIPTCYVAVTKDNIPIYRQWLIGASENKQIKNYFGNFFPKLKENEALIEGAFTHPSYRGFGIMPAATARVVEKGKEIGADYVIAFIDIKNIPPLRSFAMVGFSPYILRKERWILFFRKVVFIPISEDIFTLYNKYTANLKISKK